MPDWTIRPGRDTDAAGFIALIGACWSLYPGCVLDVDGEEPHLRALASYYADRAGALWAAECDSAIAGMVATRPLGDGVWEICKVYVSPALHGSGLGHLLLDAAEAHAMVAGASRLVLWSDTRFDRAHRFYEKRSYVRSGPIRVLHDLSNSLEFAYAKPVDGIEVLDVAAATAAIPRLSSILIACVAGGAGVSFLHPLAPDTARKFWQGIVAKIAARTHLLLAAWSGGVLAGTVTLAMDMPENQPHRAEVAKLLVDPAIRRKGLARALMIRLEQEAERAGRPMLMLDTQAGGAAESLYRSMGWTALGVMPGHALLIDGTLGDTAFFWKRLS
ncbi:MAG: GNAT family N-acetyltransferase [Rhodospirillales bacterium]